MKYEHDLTFGGRKMVAAEAARWFGFVKYDRPWIQFEIAGEEIRSLAIRRIYRRRAVYALRAQGATGRIRFSKPVILPGHVLDYAYTVIAAEQPV